MKKNWKQKLKKSLWNGFEYIFAIVYSSLFYGMFLTIWSAFILLPICCFFLKMDPQEVVGWDLGAATTITGIVFIFQDILSKKRNTENARKEEKEYVMKDCTKEKMGIENMKQIKLFNKIMKELEGDIDHQDMSNVLHKINTTILSILKHYSLEMKEEHYLTHTLPMDLTETIKIFMKLTEKNQNIMKPKIMELLVSKQKELENHYIKRGQKQWMDTLEKRIKITESRD